MVNQSDLVKNKKQYKKIFFYRICGTGMGACACLLKEAGFQVEGADASFSPPMSTYLESIGIPCFPLAEINEARLKEYDLIIVGNSVPRNSDHAKLIESAGVPFTSFPTVLGNLVLRDREVIGIAGTHGKTTTTFFIGQMLEALGEDPGYFIGGIINDRPPAKLGTSKYFVIESDEYDSAYFQKYAKFQQYELDHMILTSLEYDHADIYNNVEEIEEQFKQVFEKMPQGNFVANQSYPSIQKIGKSSWSYYSEDSNTGPDIVKMNENGTEFKLKIKNNWHTVNTKVVGLHNILNISGCILMLTNLGHEAEAVIESVKDLKMVKRRQEVRGIYKGAVVIDDFAHHPKAITLTIQGIKTLYPNREIFTIFEPVSATARSDIFQNEFTESLKLADRLILAKNPLATTVGGHSNLNCQRIVDEVKSCGKPASVVENLESLRKAIDQQVSSNQVLLILSNRTCLGLWESDFVKALQ